MPEEAVSRLRRLAFEHGETYAASLVLEPDRELFWSADRRGVIGFRRRGRYVLVADGLLAPSGERPRLLADFLAFAAARRWHASFINVPRNEINLFRNQRCEVTKIGEEPLVRLQRTQWQGKDAQWLRRQESFVRRHGVEFREVPPDPGDPEYRDAVAPQLDAISRDHIAATLHRRELKFFVSQFDPLHQPGRRVFLAEQAGRVVAFIVCNPALAGDLWAVEVYRRRPDAVRGVIPALIMHAMRRMQAEGVSYFSLSLAPFVRCTPIAGDSVVLRTVVNFWWRRLNAIYDVQGLFHFKSRFRPDYREMYLAASPCITVRSLWSLATVWELFRFNPLRLAAHGVRLAKSGDRRSLATPELGAERRLRELRRKPTQPSLPSAAP
jgi:phosphatidylglycerol lysyltransferase